MAARRPVPSPVSNPLGLKHFKPSDLRAVAQLATQATLGVVDVTEGVHQSVLRTVGGAKGRQPGRTTGVTGLVYRSVRGMAGLVGLGVDKALQALVPLLAPSASGREPTGANDTPERTQVLAVLNGVLGDRLAASHSPLALDMGFWVNGQAWSPSQPLPGSSPQPTPAKPSSHVLLTIHGLCMTDGQWLWQGHDHGAWLAERLGCSRVGLRYNSGLHIADNGVQLAALLEQLVAHWPVPLTRLSIVAHSMGGLVARSAHAAALQAGHHWPQRLQDLVFLGTPHHGSPLERAGAWVDTLLGATPFTAPFVRLGQVRSVGITDLRHGYVLPPSEQAPVTALRSSAKVWARHRDARVPLPLPERVACFAVAATLAPRSSLMAERLTGDGLVPLNSALGRHDDARHHLHFPATHQRVLYRTGHLDLLSSPVVAQQLLNWLQPADGEPATAAPASPPALDTSP